MLSRFPTPFRSKSVMTLPALLFFCTVLALLYGWVANIVAIVHTMHEPITGIFIFRVIGIFVFLIGCVMGYL
jgi:hypothetical protein